jgi:hypothetical protein
MKGRGLYRLLLLEFLIHPKRFLWHISVGDVGVNCKLDFLSEIVCAHSRSITAGKVEGYGTTCILDGRFNVSQLPLATAQEE